MFMQIIIHNTYKIRLMIIFIGWTWHRSRSQRSIGKALK